MLLRDHPQQIGLVRALNVLSARQFASSSEVSAPILQIPSGFEYGARIRHFGFHRGHSRPVPCE